MVRSVIKKVLVFLPLVSIVIILSINQPMAKTTSSESLTVTALTFEVTFEHATYTFVDPLVREIKIWATVRNTGSVADEIKFSFVQDGSTSPAGYIHLEPGESGGHEVGTLAWGMGGENGHTTYNIRIESTRNPSSVANATINADFIQINLENLPSATLTINVFDKNTNNPIEDASVFYYLSSDSRTEAARPLGDGRFEVALSDVSGPAAQYEISWAGYTIEVQASGYQTYYENGLKPQGSAITRNVYLTPLPESASFQPTWMENLEYPGVWRVRPSENWGYIAVAMGKHPDSWDPPSPYPTNVYLFKSTGELLWSYPVADTVWGVDITRDGSLVAAGTNNGVLYVIDGSGNLVWSETMGTGANIREVRFSNNGAYLGAETGSIKIFNASTGEVIWEHFPSADTHWRGITFSSDDKNVVYAGANSLILLDLENRREVWYKYISGVPYDVKLTPNLSRVVIADKGDTLWCYDGQGNLLWSQRSLVVLTGMDMIDDGLRIVTLSHDGTVRMYDDGGNLLWRRAVGSGGHNGIDMTGDGKYIIVGGGMRSVFGTGDFPYAVYLLDNDGNLLWKHSQTGPIPDPYHPYLIAAMSVAISDNGSYIAAGYGTGNPGVQLFTGSISGDSDGDGMSDAWENQYGLNSNDSSDANQDKDGDGYTNLQEYQAGTNPTLASSYPSGTPGENIPEAGEAAPGERNWLLIAGIVVVVVIVALIAVVKFRSR